MDVELTSQGFSQRNIAAYLQIRLDRVNKDLLFLRRQAQDNPGHIQQTLPEGYHYCMVWLELKQALIKLIQFNCHRVNQ